MKIRTCLTASSEKNVGLVEAIWLISN